ncbi:MAG: response regulator [Chitinophagaceae bacterium]
MTIQKEPIKVALTDDHSLVRNAIADLINSYGDCQVIHQSSNGLQLKQAIEQGSRPEVVVLDLHMPEMNGFETAKWLRDNHPNIHIILLSSFDSEYSIIRLLQAGVRGFLKKDINTAELRFAIQSISQTGYYYSNASTGKILSMFRDLSSNNLSRLHKNMLSDLEIRFIKLACSDLTYKEIAQKMGLSPRSIDSIRDQLFVKLDVRSRVGLTMLAIKHGIESL